MTKAMIAGKMSMRMLKERALRILIAVWEAAARLLRRFPDRAESTRGATAPTFRPMIM